MERKFKQIIFCNSNSTANTAGVTIENLNNGDAFQAYLPLSQLGVRALPGTKFYVNGNENPVIIGFTGMFEMDLDSAAINSLSFDIDSLRRIERDDSAYLVVDMLGLGGN